MILEEKNYQKFHQCEGGIFFKIYAQSVDIFLPFIGSKKITTPMTVECKKCNLKLIPEEVVAKIKNELVVIFLNNNVSLTKDEVSFVLDHKSQSWPKALPKKDYYNEEDLKLIKKIINY